MAFRDEEGALRAKLEKLSGDLSATQEQLAVLQEEVRRLKNLSGSQSGSSSGRGGRVHRGEDAPCLYCGGSHFAWGELRAEHLRFVSNEEGWFSANFTLSSGVRARRCAHCASVVIFDVQ